MWIAPGDYHLVVQPRVRTCGCISNQRGAGELLPAFRGCAVPLGGPDLSRPRLWPWCSPAWDRMVLRGCELLAAAGREIVVQDEATSVVWGMPGFVATGRARRRGPADLRDWRRTSSGGSPLSGPSTSALGRPSGNGVMSLAPIDFDYLRTLLKHHTAIVLDPGKEYLAETRLAPLVSEQGCSLSAGVAAAYCGARASTVCIARCSTP